MRIYITLLILQGRPELNLGSDAVVQKGHTADHLGACGLSRAQEGTLTLLPAAEVGREGWQSTQVGSVCQARPFSPASSVHRPKLTSICPQALCFCLSCALECIPVKERLLLTRASAWKSPCCFDFFDAL